MLKVEKKKNVEGSSKIPLAAFSGRSLLSDSGGDGLATPWQHC